jgi:hypothetical protein
VSGAFAWIAKLAFVLWKQMKPKLTKATFILAVASVAVIGLALIILMPRKLPPIKGSLSEDEARAVLKKLDHVRWRAAYISLSKWDFRTFGLFVSENFRLRPVSVEGDSTNAVVRCPDRLNRVSATYHFENKGGGWSLTTVKHYEFFISPAKQHESTTQQPP